MFAAIIVNRLPLKSKELLRSARDNTDPNES